MNQCIFTILLLTGFNVSVMTRTVETKLGNKEIWILLDYQLLKFIFLLLKKSLYNKIDNKKILSKFLRLFKNTFE